MAKGNGKMVFVGVGVLLLLGLIAYFSYAQNIATPEPSENIPTGSCDSTTTPNLSINAFDKDNVGTALTEGTNLYREKGKKSWSTFTAGTGFDVGALKTYEIVMGISTTDQTDNAYGTYFEYTVPCEETPSIEREMANDEIETSLSATFYNKDDNAAAQTFLAGDTYTIEFRLKAGTDEYFGNPLIGENTGVMCLDLNSTQFDKPESVNVKGGSDLAQVSMPQRHSAVAGKIAYCYELPAIGDKEVSIEVALNADDSTAPAVDDTAYFYAGGYFINAETGNVEIGVEDEEGNAVGTDAADSATIDVTA